jgi:superfamily I DNA/RNA helicase
VAVHQAKGLEAERVFITRPDLMPLTRVRQEWELQQELNIEYVAYTRSKSELFFVEGSE